MIGLYDISILPIYLIFIYIVMFYWRNYYIKELSYYKYFVQGLTVKIFGAVALCLIYTYYYDGGDTVNYFKGGQAVINMAGHDFGVFVDIMLGNLTEENYLAFTYDTGYPPTYMYRDPHTFSVVRFTVPVQLISGNSFLVTAVLLSVFSYSGVWKLYQLFIKEFPGINRALAFSILFVPSVFFWGSGILKDTFSFAAACWFTYALYMLFIQRKKLLPYSIAMLISIYVMIEIKPYIFIALLPGSMMWLLLTYLKNIKNFIIRTFSLPLIVTVLGVLVIFTFRGFGDAFGKYSVENIVDQAVITREDLSRAEQYGTNQFQLDFDGSLSSMLRSAPLAIMAALFRPFLWESGNPMMLLSALENTFIMGLVILTLLTRRIGALLRIIRNNPILTFSLLFSLFFAFSVGLTTANFGALVRYKIPLMPFFIASFVVLRYYNYILIRREELGIASV